MHACLHVGSNTIYSQKFVAPHAGSAGVIQGSTGGAGAAGVSVFLLLERMRLNTEVGLPMRDQALKRAITPTFDVLCVRLSAASICACSTDSI